MVSISGTLIDSSFDLGEQNLASLLDLPFNGFFIQGTILVMPSFTSKIEEITVHENFDVPANGFNIRVADTQAYVKMGQFDPIDIEVGYRDPSTLAVYTIGLIRNGVIDAVDFEAGLNNRTAVARGRDAAALLLDQYFEKIYVPANGILTTVQAPDGSRYVNFVQQGQTQVETIETVPVPTVGVASHFIPVVQETSARRIAIDICASVGMTVAWHCRDYVLRDTFEAAGRIIDVLRELIAPWNVTELFKVDIYIQANVVFFKQRDLLNLSTDYTFTVPNAKIKNLSSSKKIAPLIGRLILEGMPVPIGLSNTAGTSVFVDDVEDKERVILTYDPSGKIIITTETFLEKFRKPDGVLLQYTDTLYDMIGKTLVKEEKRLNEWEDPQYRLDGQINQPLQVSTISETKSISSSDGVFRTAFRQEISYRFDSNRLLESETTVTSTFDEQAGVTKAEMVVKALSDFGHNQVLQVTTILKAEKTGEISNSSTALKFIVFSIDTQINPGQRPGGTQPPSSISINANSGRQSVRIEKVLSIDKKALPFTYSNKYLSLLDLQFILAQLTNINGGFLYEVTWVGVSIPWIRKGNVVQFTQLKDENGVDISLNPILVTAVELSLKLGFGDKNELTAQYTGIFWKAT